MKAKTHWILSCLLLYSGLNLFSQEFKFGFLAGFDVAKSYLANNIPENTANSDYHPMISYNVNGYIGYKSKGIWGLSVEPGFIQKGYSIKFQNHNVRFQLNYLQMPVLADIYFTDKIFLSVGPELAYLLNAKIKTVSDKGDISDIYDRKFELSGIAGINYKITGKFDAGFRYSHGFMYTMEIPYTDANGHLIAKSEEYNQYFQLIVRYRL